MNYPPFQSVLQSFKQLFITKKTSVRFTVQIILLLILFYSLGGAAFGHQIYGHALELQPYNENYTLLGTRKSDGTLLDIAQFPLPTSSTNIPLAVDATITGTYHLSATDMDLPAGTQLYLYDTQTGLMDELLDYVFTISKA